MKLRIQANSVRLRLSEAEVACVARSESISEQTVFPNGVLSYQLSLGGEEISARYSADQGIEIEVPQRQAIRWATGGEISLSQQVVLEGDPLMVLIEKDLKAHKD
jgi:hypothetical protein